MPRKLTRKAAEADVRNPVVRFHLQNGDAHVRMSMARGVKRGTPDDLFLFPLGRSCWIEFKRPGKKPTPLQAYRIAILRRNDHVAFWCDQPNAAMYALDLCKRGREVAVTSDNKLIAGYEGVYYAKEKVRDL